MGQTMTSLSKFLDDALRPLEKDTYEANFSGMQVDINKSQVMLQHGHTWRNCSMTAALATATIVLSPEKASPMEDLVSKWSAWRATKSEEHAENAPFVEHLVCLGRCRRQARFLMNGKDYTQQPASDILFGVFLSSHLLSAIERTFIAENLQTAIEALRSGCDFQLVGEVDAATWSPLDTQQLPHLNRVLKVGDITNLPVALAKIAGSMDMTTERFATEALANNQNFVLVDLLVRTFEIDQVAVPGLNNGLKCNSEHACLHEDVGADDD